MKEMPERREGEDEEKAAWEAYRRHQSESGRNKLCLLYQEHVRKIAAYLYGRYGGSDVSFDDFMQFGLLGLIESVERYQPELGASFRTYSGHRIRGAILSGLADSTERLQYMAFRRKQRNDKIRSIVSNARREQGDALEKLIDVTLDVAFGHVLGMEALTENEAEAIQSPYFSSHQGMLDRDLAKLMDVLSASEREVIRCHYYQGTDFQQIADIMQLSKSRVSQIHASALRKLRQAYADKPVLDVKG